MCCPNAAIFNACLVYGMWIAATLSTILATREVLQSLPTPGVPRYLPEPRIATQRVGSVFSVIISGVSRNA